MVTPALPVRPLYTALMVALPVVATAVARPFELVLFIETTAGAELDQVAELVTFVPFGDGVQPLNATPEAV